MTFNTGNNVPSTDPRDLYDNAENLDKLINGAEPFYADRKGKLRESWAGMENSFTNAQEGRETAFTLSQADKESRFQAFLVSSGYVSKGDYAAGVVLAERNEYVAVDAATTGTSPGLYRPNASATLPLTLTGTWATDSAGLVMVGDDVLRQEMAADNGSGLVGYAPDQVYPSGTVGEELKALAASVEAGSGGIPGAAGDGVADDTAAIAAALASGAAAGRLTFGKGLTYRLTGQLTIDAPIRIDLNGSTLEFEFDAALQNGCGFSVQSDSVTIENGTIRVSGTAPGVAASAHVPIYAGNESTGAGWQNLEFRALRLHTMGNGGIVCMGENRNATVENIEIEDSAGIRLGVAFEWGGTPEVGTGHPHNITIRNIKAGAFTYPGAPAVNSTCVVWLSSAFNVEMSNITADQVPTLVNVFTGDKSNLHAPAAYKNLVGTGITLDNASCEVVTGYGIRVYGKGTDSPIPLPQSVHIRNVNLKGTPSLAYVHMGLLLEFCDGVRIENFSLDGFYHGIITGADVKNFVADHGVIRNCQLLGAQLGSGGFPSINPTIRDVLFHGNNAQATTGISTATAVLITDTRDAVVENCRFGFEGVSEKQVYCIHATSQARRPRLNNNHASALASGGVCYVVGDTQSATEVNATGCNNTAAAGLVIAGGAPIFVTGSNGDRAFTSAAVPSGGAYQRGDRCYFDDPTAAGFIGAVCVTAGSPGVWKNFGAIAA